jgi:hypothetical protein
VYKKATKFQFKNVVTRALKGSDCAVYPHPRPFSRLDHKTHLAGMVATSGEGRFRFYSCGSRFCSFLDWRPCSLGAF